MGETLAEALSGETEARMDLVMALESHSRIRRWQGSATVQFHPSRSRPVVYETVWAGACPLPKSLAGALPSTCSSLFLSHGFTSLG